VPAPVTTAALLAAFGPFRDLAGWAKVQGLEIILLVSGSVLLVRLAHWSLARYADGVAVRPAWLFRALDGAGPDRRRRQALIRALGWVFTAMVTVVVGALIATRLGVPLTTVVPPATIAGVAVGFGAQRVVQDVLSGFFLLSERQINVGDVIRVSPPGTTSGVSGTVEEVTMRVTRIRTVKGEVVFIPNGEIRQLTNLSVEWARLVVDVPLRSTDDVPGAITRLRQVSEEMAADPAWEDVLLEGPEVLGVEDLELELLRVRVVARVRPSDQWRAGRELRLRITSGLAEAGISTVLPVHEPDGAV
jgi:moderate conductance mechanosensitive channel